MTPGQLAYEAYCNTTSWKSAVSGAPLPQFNDQSDLVKSAWENAARASASESVVVGALFAILSYATTRKGTLKLGGNEECSPAVDLIKEFCALHGLNMDNPNVETWRAHTAVPPKTTHEHRVRQEARDLDGNLMKLESFLITPTFASLSFEEQGRLQRQARHMTDYSQVLAERIAAF